jgi:large subunit ribosomal protein L15
MKVNDLAVSAHRRKNRVGRGISAGQGKTAGRGTKGQKSRTGSKRRPGFEGGQNPIMQRLPKLRGFRSIRVPAENVYTSQLDQSGLNVIDNFSLAQSGLTTSPNVKVKLLFDTEPKNKLAVKLQSASQKSIEAIQKAGGSFEKVAQVKRTKKTSNE